MPDSHDSTIKDRYRPGVGFTGTQDGMAKPQAASVTTILPRLLDRDGWKMHHGDCVGADAEVHAICRSFRRCFMHLHPPINESKRAFCKADFKEPPKEYIARNHDIVDATPTLLATPKAMVEELRSGTWATIRYARKLGRRIFIVYPDGTVWFERGGIGYAVDLAEWLGSGKL